MATSKKGIADKQYLAKILYTRENLEGKIVAKKVGVSEKTISNWVNQFNWKSLRRRLLMSKEELLNSMYEQFESLNEKIKAQQDKHADSRQADILIKYTAAIKNFETELAIADIVDTGIKFIKFLQQTGTTDEVIATAELWHSFIQHSIKK